MRMGGEKRDTGERRLPKKRKQTDEDNKGAYGRTGQKHRWDVG